MGEQYLGDKENLTWRPLTDRPSRILTPDLGDQGIMMGGAFGSCVDRSARGCTSYRDQALIPIFAEQGIADRVFNPEVDVWTPERARIESILFSRACGLYVVADNETDGPASLLEATIGAYIGPLRGQDVFVYIEQNEESPETTQVARKLSKMALEVTGAQYPLFCMTDSIEDLSRRAAYALLDRIRQQDSGVTKKVEYSLPNRQNDLNLGIHLSGTAGKKRPMWMDIVKTIINGRAPVDDSYRKDWNVATDGYAELKRKGENAVQLVAITYETESLAALATLGTMIMQADMNEQSLGIYIGPHNSPPNSPTNRTRTLAKAHLTLLSKDFPHLPFFIADTLEELASYGVTEYRKQRQRLQEYSI